MDLEPKMENTEEELNIDDYAKMKSLLKKKSADDDAKRVQEHRLSNFDLVSIGTMESIFNKKNGTPRQSGICPQSKGIIRLHKTLFNNPGHLFDGIDQFEFVW